jgi:ficolin
MFSTNDQRNGGNSCPVQRHGGWWYKTCAAANLNGQFQPGVSNLFSVSWESFRGNYFSLKRAQMMMRKK